MAPNGSKTPVLIFISFATALMIFGLNCGSENTQATLSCSIISLISANCSAPGITSVFTVNTDVMPGAEQLAEIREIIEHDKITCIFSEPQFNPDIINAVAKDMDIKTGVLDPLGATLDPGKDLYFDLIKNMSKSFKGC